MVDEGAWQQREKHRGRSLRTSDTEVMSPALALGGGRGGVQRCHVKSWTVSQTWTLGREGNKSMNPRFQDGKIGRQVFQFAFCLFQLTFPHDSSPPTEASTGTTAGGCLVACSQICHQPLFLYSQAQPRDGNTLCGLTLLHHLASKKKCHPRQVHRPIYSLSRELLSWGALFPGVYLTA